MKTLFLLTLCLSAWFANAAKWQLADMRVTAPNAKHRFAADELRNHLNLVAGTAARNGTGNIHELLVGVPAEKSPLAPGESRWRVQNGKIYFYGDDSNRRNGTLFAVYGFLEDQLGVRWPRPGDANIHAPRRTSIELAEGTNYRRVPPFRWAEVRTYFWNRADQSNRFAPPELRLSPEEIARHMRDNQIFGLRMRHGTVHKIRYAHAFTQWPDRFGQTHPEYFGMNPYGKREIPAHQKKFAKLCLSNSAVIDQIIADWSARGKPKYLNVSPNDGTPGFCRCPHCMALDARLPGESFYDHLTDRYLNFWNRIAERAVALNPEVVLATYVYSYYRHAPRREKIKFPEHMLCGLVPSLTEDSGPLFDAWKKVGMKHCFLRPNDLFYTGAVPRGMARRIYDKFQQTRTFDLAGVDYDATLGLRAIDFEIYTASRMIAFPEKSFDDIAEEYFSTFGGAAPVARAFYQAQTRDGEQAVNRLAVRLRQSGKLMLDDSELGIAEDDRLLNELREQRKILDRADSLKLVPDDRRRLNQLKLLQDHAILTAQFLRSGRCGTGSAADPELETRARDLVEFRIRHRDELDENWGLIFGRNELPFWKRTDYYRKHVARTADSGPAPENGWRSSFDQPSLDGWKAREGLDKITDEDASFDRYSIRVKSLSGDSIVLWRPRIRVVPGGRYRLSADIKSAAANQGMRIRVVRDGKTFATLKLSGAPGSWHSAQLEFTVPADTDTLTFYLVAAPAKIPRWIDNIELRKR